MRNLMMCTLFALMLFFAACSESPGKTPNSASNDVANNGRDGGANNLRNDGGGGPSVCEGFTAPRAEDGECRSDADCTGGAFCSPSADSGGCGAGCPVSQTCASDADCEDGSVCQERALPGDGCCPPGTIASYCSPPCTADSCNSDETCDEDGHCRPTSCEAGFVCAGDSVCAPGRARADAYGCAPPDCTVDDYDCPDGFSCESGASTPTKCAPIHCNDGYDCPANSRCEGEGDAHGCTKMTCDADSSCDCGACVNGRCEAYVWVCAHLAA